MRRLLLSLALLASLPAFANLELTVNTHSVMKPKKGITVLEGAKGEERKTKKITLGANFHRSEEDGAVEIVDYAKRRVYRLSKGSLTDRSLFYVAGSRDRELENRIYLAEVSRDMKLNEGHFALPHQEHELSVRRESTPVAGLETKAARGEQQFRIGPEELMSWSTETHPATPAERTMFVRFFRHAFGGHPQILAALGRVDGIPKWLRMSEPRWGRSTRIDVTEVRSTPDAPYVPLAGEEKFEDAEFAALVAAVRTSTPESRKQAADAIIAEARRAAEAGRMLVAAAGFMEASMMNGEMPPDTIYEEQFRTDPDMAAFSGALNPRSAEEGKAAVATLTRLQLTAQRKAYVLAIFRANHQQNLRQYDAADRDYRTALKANPLLTGVWKDYGEYFLNRYDAREAWHCWDLARFLAPDHPLLDEVEKLEARLLERYPEYF